MQRQTVMVEVSGPALLRSTVLESLCRTAGHLGVNGQRLAVLCGDEDVRRLLGVAGFSRRFDLIGRAELAPGHEATA